MPATMSRPPGWRAALALALLLPAVAAAQHPYRTPPPSCCPPPGPSFLPSWPTAPAPQTPSTPNDPAKPSDPTRPETPSQPQQPSQDNANNNSSLNNESFAAGGGESGAATIGAGYVDPAWVRTQVRIRFDAGYRDNRPDRAEFFYAGPAGPPLPERSIDFQDLSTYIEGAFNDRLSAFVELPVRWLNPQVNANAVGLGDMNAGFKVGILTDPKQLLTFQLRGYAPSGDPGRGLGNAHASLEPGILYHQQWDRLFFDGEFKYWVPLNSNGFSGDIFRYGGGVSYNLASCPNRFLAPVFEVVGWTVLDGRVSLPAAAGMETTQSAAGDTIINAKFGVRYGWDPLNSVYIGYGRALTGDVWYKDLLRLEFRRAF